MKSDGTLWDWGNNVHGELGVGTTTNQLSPTQVPSLTSVTAVAGGAFHSLAVKSDGSVWSWGSNTFGQRGDGTTTNRLSPVLVGGSLSGMVAVAAGSYHSLALKSDGTLWSWGGNWQGQVGALSNLNQSLPVQVTGLQGQGAIVASKEHALTTAPNRLATTATTTYSYDKLYRLTGVTSPSGTNTYGYDPLGNRLSKVLNGSSTSSTYDRADRILTAGSTTYTVNNAGNQTGKGTDSLSCDQANRLTGTAVAGVTSTYHYDGDGKRISKTVGSTTTNYVNDVGGGLPVLVDDYHKSISEKCSAKMRWTLLFANLWTRSSAAGQRQPMR